MCSLFPKNLILKLLASSCYGLFIGFIVNKFIFSKLPTQLPVNWSFYVLSSTSLLVALFCQFSIKFRCISILIWLELLGKTGRKIIKALLFILILLGPIENTVTNAKEVARVFGCTTYLTYNLTKTKVELAVKPVTNAFTNMNRLHVSDVEEIVQDIKAALLPVVNEVEHAFSKR